MSKNAFLLACECNQLNVARFLSTLEDASVRFKAAGVNNAYACVLQRIQSEKDNWGDAPEEWGKQMPDFDAKYANMLAFLRDDVGLNTRPPRCESPVGSLYDSSDMESDDDLTFEIEED